jgi:hypothetical protein
VPLPITFEKTVALPPAAVLRELRKPGVWRQSTLSPELRDAGIFEFEVRPGGTGVRFVLLEAGQWSPPFLRARVTASDSGARIHVCIRRSLAVLIVPLLIAALMINSYLRGNALTWDDLVFGGFIAYGVLEFCRIGATDERMVHFLIDELERRLQLASRSHDLVTSRGPVQ